MTMIIWLEVSTQCSVQFTPRFSYKRRKKIENSTYKVEYPPFVLYSLFILFLSFEQFYPVLCMKSENRVTKWTSFTKKRRRMKNDSE